MKLGIIGAGGIVRATLPDIQAAGIEVTAIAGTPRSVARTRELAATHGIERTYTDAHDLLNAAEVDAVYVAVPNHLHAEMARLALETGVSVICEKPLTSTYEEAVSLTSIARDKNLFLWEAIVPLHQPSFHLMREQLESLGDIRIVTASYSQYSSRFDAFQEGTVLPAFDPACAGGALMDLGIYGLSMVMGLFGAPDRAHYAPNITRGIDTSGIMHLDYGSFQASIVCAKDCDGASGLSVQGTRGYLMSELPPNDCGHFTVRMHGGEALQLGVDAPSRFLQEFKDFKRQWDEDDTSSCYEELERSLDISRTLHTMRKTAGIVFPADNMVTR